MLRHDIPVLQQRFAFYLYATVALWVQVASKFRSWGLRELTSSGVSARLGAVLALFGAGFSLIGFAALKAVYKNLASLREKFFSTLPRAAFSVFKRVVKLHFGAAPSTVFVNFAGDIRLPAA